MIRPCQMRTTKGIGRDEKKKETVKVKGNTNPSYELDEAARQLPTASRFDWDRRNLTLSVPCRTSSI